MGAGLQLNSGHKWGPKAFNDMTESPINPVYEIVAQQAEKKIKSEKLQQKQKIGEVSKNMYSRRTIPLVRSELIVDTMVVLSQKSLRKTFHLKLCKS